MLEWVTLSRLTGDDRFERASKRAMRRLWRLRSALNLVGNTVRATDGMWIDGLASTGAEIDSFYETMLKASILTGEAEWQAMFVEARRGVERHINHHGLHRAVNMWTGNQA